MSAEHFTTIFTADLKTAEDKRGVEVAESGKGAGLRWSQSWGPNAIEEARGGWASCYLHAEMVLHVVAETVRHDVMDGISGDRPDERKHLADIVDTVAVLVRDLALDAAHDGSFDPDHWRVLLDNLSRVVSGEEQATPRRSTLLVHHPEEAPA